MWRKYAKSSAVYHTTSPIENFEFVVTLQNISSLIKVPKYDTESSVQGLSASDELYEEVRFRWQEKVFSSIELEVYSNAENCLNDVQKEYNNRILNGDNLREGKIFSYVQGDNYSSNQIFFSHTESNTVIPWEHERTIADEEETMFVYASLNPDALLFHVRWRPKEAVLIVFPDFTSSDNDPYYIEIDTDYRHLYSYTVKNVSKSLEVSTPMSDAVCKSAYSTVTEKVKDAFDMPPLLSTRISLMLEIISATHFEYESLHIRYKLSVPEVFIVEEGATMGSTHSSISRNSQWNFGYCFQLTVLSAGKVNFQDNLVVYLEAVSKDSWSRERCEGFTHVILELRPGTHLMDLPCYRIDYGFYDEIVRFFIGGNRRFDQEHFNRGEGEFLNRYQQKTISTGSIKMKCQVIMQKSVSVAGDSQVSRTRWDHMLQKHSEARKRLKIIVH